MKSQTLNTTQIPYKLSRLDEAIIPAAAKARALSDSELLSRRKAINSAVEGRYISDHEMIEYNCIVAEMNSRGIELNYGRQKIRRQVAFLGKIHSR